MMVVVIMDHQVLRVLRVLQIHTEAVVVAVSMVVPAAVVMEMVVEEAVSVTETKAAEAGRSRRRKINPQKSTWSLSVHTANSPINPPQYTPSHNPLHHPPPPPTLTSTASHRVVVVDPPPPLVVFQHSTSSNLAPRALKVVPTPLTPTCACARKTVHDRLTAHPHVVEIIGRRLVDITEIIGRRFALVMGDNELSLNSKNDF